MAGVIHLEQCHPSRLQASHNVPQEEPPFVRRPVRVKRCLERRYYINRLKRQSCESLDIEWCPLQSECLMRFGVSIIKPSLSTRVRGNNAMPVLLEQPRPQTGTCADVQRGYLRRPVQAEFTDKAHPGFKRMPRTIWNAIWREKIQIARMLRFNLLAYLRVTPWDIQCQILN